MALTPSHIQHVPFCPHTMQPTRRSCRPGQRQMDNSLSCLAQTLHISRVFASDPVGNNGNTGTVQAAQHKVMLQPQNTQAPADTPDTPLCHAAIHPNTFLLVQTPALPLLPTPLLYLFLHTSSPYSLSELTIPTPQNPDSH